MKILGIRKFTLIFAAFTVLLLQSCGQQNASQPAEPAAPVTPVGITYPQFTSLSDDVSLDATSVYLQKSEVKATTNGYVQSMNVQVGQQVHAGDVLFSLVTKEAKAIGNAINKLDPALKFSGVSKIRANESGFITEVSRQKGDYVQDGEVLARISNRSSLVFMLDLPYELRQILNHNKQLELTLPDGERLTGTLGASLSKVDSAAQTQGTIIRVNPSHAIPEGLVAKVKLVKSFKANAQTLPKQAVLSNETEDEFWVMKMINDTMAVKISVKKGMEDSKATEIISPVFGRKDRIISSGNYGMADTARVSVIK